MRGLNGFLIIGFWILSSGCATALRGTGDLGLIIERADGSAAIVDTTRRVMLEKVSGLGDLSHASVVFSRDARFAYVFGRDGGLTQIDLLTAKIVKRVVQGGNAIGGAISQDGQYVAVSNYEPGGVKVFQSSDLELVTEIPALGADGRRSKVVGLIDLPGQRFAFSLFESGEIWVADLKRSPRAPELTRFTGIGKEPYDALISPEGRYYVAGLFGEDGLARVDTWHLDRPVERVLPHYGRGKKALPVYKMPHLEGWASSGELSFVPAVGLHEILVVRTRDWKEMKRISVKGQPVFAVANPDGRQVWVNFALPDNHRVQVIDTEKLEVVHTFEPGKGVLHLEFSPKGDEVWLSLRDENRVDIFRTDTFERVKTLPMRSPSGIFFTSRAHRIGL